jgi:putative membrane protein
MMLIVHWLLSALSLLLVAHFVPGFHMRGFGTALIAAVVIGLVNATFGFVLKILTLPLTIVTFGLFLLVINAIMLKLAAALVPGFEVYGFLPALLGAIILSVISLVLRSLVY